MNIGPDKSNTQLDQKVFSSILNYLNQQQQQQPPSIPSSSSLNQNNPLTQSNQVLLPHQQQLDPSSDSTNLVQFSSVNNNNHPTINNINNNNYNSYFRNLNATNYTDNTNSQNYSLSSVNSDLIQQLLLTANTSTGSSSSSSSLMPSQMSTTTSNLQENSTCNHLNMNNSSLTEQDDPANHLLTSPTNVTFEMLLANVIKSSSWDVCQTTMVDASADVAVDRGDDYHGVSTTAQVNAGSGTSSINSNTVNGNNASNHCLQQRILVNPIESQQMTPQRLIINMQQQEVIGEPHSAAVASSLMTHSHMSPSATCHQIPNQEYHSNCSKSSASGASSSFACNTSVGDLTPITTTTTNSSRNSIWSSHVENSDFQWFESTSSPHMTTLEEHSTSNSEHQQKLVPHKQSLVTSLKNPKSGSSKKDKECMTPPRNNPTHRASGGIKKKKRKPPLVVTGISKETSNSTASLLNHSTPNTSNTHATTTTTSTLMNVTTTTSSSLTTPNTDHSTNPLGAFSLTTPEEMSLKFQRMSNEEGVKRKRGRPKKETEPYEVRFVNVENPQEFVTKKR
ncbi:hypothetical protein C9374_000332 [Naegleria lovaniensis]|uniref:Uncharacterized protein n=1 Tax=Naegleria lovaniensis TaxID=51637 RepID=A0AA88GYU2_NAELO|nr:uncharacterized protein C9374_000332 [Naegleria lovaniensis]KAG2388893.1 hypothetical protein C9374_000332 [Naegleria lovaniensis]